MFFSWGEGDWKGLHLPVVKCFQRICFLFGFCWGAQFVWILCGVFFGC